MKKEKETEGKWFYVGANPKVTQEKEEEEEEEKAADGEARLQEISQQFNKLFPEPIGRWEPIRKEEPIRNQEQIRMQEPVVVSSFILLLSWRWFHFIQSHI